MLRRTTASPRPASGAGVRSMRARPATSATRPRRPVAKWPNASSAGASNTARCARPNIEASQPSLPTSCSISSPTISCAFPSSSPPEAESAHKPENRFGQTEIQQQRTETAWLPQVFQQTAKADAVMAGDDFAPLEPLPLAGLRFGIAQGFPLENLDETVAAAFDAATERLTKAGVRLTPEPMPLFDEMRQVNAYGGVVQAEAYAIHQDRVKRRAADIDPNIRVRLERCGAVAAADYINMLYASERFVCVMERVVSVPDALR